MEVQLTEAEKIKIMNSGDIFSIMQKILSRENKIDRDKEHFWIIGLANNHRILLAMFALSVDLI
jgi:DNA repair protein RadC